MAYSQHIKCSIIFNGRTFSELNRFCRGNGYLGSKSLQIYGGGCLPELKISNSISHKDKRIFKQDHAHRIERGEIDLFSSDIFKSPISLFVFLSLCTPRYSEREHMEVNQEGKVTLQKREERYLAYFLHKLT